MSEESRPCRKRAPSFLSLEEHEPGQARKFFVRSAVQRPAADVGADAAGAVQEIVGPAGVVLQGPNGEATRDVWQLLLADGVRRILGNHGEELIEVALLLQIGRARWVEADV